VGATVIGVGADAVEQLVRPDTGQTTVNLLGTVTGEAVNKVLPIAAPLTNEIVEGLKGSDKADQIKKETNSFIEWLSK
jgi:filamentous hemagglutinin